MAARLLVVCLPVLLAIGPTHATDPTNSTRRLKLFGWHLELENNEDMQSPECAECQFYTGRVLCEEVSMAMVTECDGRWYGLVQVGNEVFLLPKREEGHVLKKRDALLALVEENLSLFDLKDDTLPAPTPADAALDEGVTKTRIHTRSSQTTHEDYFKYGQSDAPSKQDSKLWLELVIVADQTMLKFHGDARKVRHYILALMNIVSAIFNDRSLSAGMTIVVSQIHVFDKYDPTHIRNGNMQEKLRRINQWNTKQLLKTYASSRWDALVWLTRTEAGVGSPAGIALPDGVCSLNHSATLQRDAGFTSAFVIAHELGHLLGMRHDDEVKFCGAAAAARGRRVKTIMNSLVLASLDFSWSQCSRDTFHDKARKWKCLQERSGVEGVEVGGRKYHSEYSMDQQCRVAFGQRYSTCKLKMDSPPCSVLYCTHELDPGTCISKNNGEPPLEGTPCKKDHWCAGGECRLMPGLQQKEEKPSEKLPNEKLPSEKITIEKLPSEKLSHEIQREPCAAACGYGLRKSSEHCDDGAGCDTRVESCWSGRRCARALDRRAELCRQLSHHYLPFVHQDKSKQCELWCEDRLGGEPYRVGDLPTGTPCSYGRPYDICFNGVCVPGNCDPTDPDCNACAGGRCRNHTSTMRPQLFDDDLHWTSLVIVPRGVHQFSIHIITPQPLDIAITIPIWNYTVKFKDHAKAQIQGNHLKYDISAPQSLRFVPLGDDAMDLGEEEQRMEGRLVVAGMVVEWTQGDKEVVIRSDSPAMSSVTFLGRHPKGYSFVMTGNDDIMADTVNVSINYTMVPRKVKRYRGPCSVSCGGGRRVVRTCGRHSCKAKYEPCNTQRCQFSWMTGAWEECSQTCGTAGLQERQLYCVPDQLRSYSLDVLKRHSVSPALCGVDLVPEKQRACNNFPCPVYWQELPWTECSTTCGPGQQHRPLQCPAEVDALCGPPPAVRRQVCRRARCEPQAYHLSDSKTQAYQRSDSKDCGLYAARQLRTYCKLPYFRRRCNKTCQEMNT